MSLIYTDKTGTKLKDIIVFQNVTEIGSTIAATPITTKDNYTIDDNDIITNKNSNIINAIDIDWNGATFKTLGKYTSNSPYATLNTTGDLLRAVGNGIDEAYDKGNSALTRADDAYDLAQQALDAGNIDSDTINQIKSILDNGVVSEFRDNLPNLYHYVKPSNAGYVRLSYIDDKSYIPVSINFETNSNRIDFGVSKDYIGEGLIYNDQTNKIDIINYNEIAYKDYVIGLIDDNKYTSGSYINIEDNEISVDTNDLLTYLKSTELNNKIEKLNYSSPIFIGSSEYPNKPEISFKYNTSYFDIETPTGSTIGQLTLKQDIINKINSGGSGQGTITIDSTISDNSTNPVQNKVIKQYIDGQLTSFTQYIDGQLTSFTSNLSSLAGTGLNYTNNQFNIDNTTVLTKGGNTTGNLTVIDGTQVNESTVTTDGTDIYVSSDRKLKDNILDIRQDEVDKLFNTESGNMHYFEWKESHKPSFGFIAQELIDFAPETVTKDTEYMQVNYNAALAKTCAAMFKKIKELENRIKELENK